VSIESRLAPLLTRKSVPARLLGPPGPTEEELHALVEAAARVPDHGRLQPWRIIAIHGAAGAALGEALLAVRRERGESLERAEVEKELGRFTRSPLVLAVIARLTPNHKIPEIEQLCSAAALTQNLLIGAQALGYGAQWLTGWPAHDPGAWRTLGLGPHERVVGFVYIGTPTAASPDRERPSYRELLSHWCVPDAQAS
jgi:nitroreductase